MELGVEHLGVGCGGEECSLLRSFRRLVSHWGGPWLCPTHSHVAIVLCHFVMDDGAGGDCEGHPPSLAMGVDPTESTPVMCPACPPQASLVMTITPNIQLSIPGVRRTWGTAQEPYGKKYICAAEAPSVSSSSSSSSFRPLS